jgi:hypothetical protein
MACEAMKKALGKEDARVHANRPRVLFADIQLTAEHLDLEMRPWQLR